MRSRTAVAAMAAASPEAHAALVMDLVGRAERELRALAREARAKPPGWALLVTEADQVEIAGSKPDMVAKHAALEPGDPWVELRSVSDIFKMVGADDGSRAWDRSSALHRGAIQKRPPNGGVWLVVAVGGTLVSFAAVVEPLPIAAGGPS